MIDAAWICLFAPLGAFFAIVLGGNRIGRQDAGLIATGGVAIGFAGAVVAFVQMLRLPVEQRAHLSTLWTWLDGGAGVKVGLSILVDPLAVFMMLIVAGVGALIVAYSIGYMDGDDEERRFFAYMALFVFSMLLLVQAGNLLLLLAGWGMVGLSSYLLIGFWHQRPEAVAAAKKAFVVNAVGDATIAIALFLIVQHTRSLDLGNAFAGLSAERGNHWLVNIVALGLLGGAIAKSAQLPLQTWLPDAMEGPTPVSALIHAATMVTAGVYLIARMHPLFELAPKVQDVAAGLGAATLVLAGLVALVQTDIKRVIAYSTMSQIGYMFVGVGVGAYAGGMFHLLTHAFFKALLFLAAGVVIHALAGEQDIRKMGGLRRLMPFTFVCFWIGGLALVGVPPFAGFFSKDAIIASTLQHGAYGAVLWVACSVGAFLTGLYTFRMIFMVFGGAPSSFVEEHHHAHHGKEGPWTMIVPVGALAALSLLGGWIQFGSVWHLVSTFLDPAVPPLREPNTTQETLTSVVAVVLGVVGIAVAWWLYSAKRERPPKPVALLEKKFYFDELYEALVAYPYRRLAKGFGYLIEGPVIGGTITAAVRGTLGTSRATSLLQSGLIRAYAFALASGVAVLAIVFAAAR